MKAQKIKEQAKFTGWYEDSNEEVTGYNFTEEEMAIFWSQLCKEQRELCLKAWNLGERIADAPEPEFEEL